jgi:hypothetical protein
MRNAAVNDVALIHDEHIALANGPMIIKPGGFCDEHYDGAASEGGLITSFVDQLSVMSVVFGQITRTPSEKAVTVAM